ncbi:hypothetical protein P691DRAFT_712076 [Macrolepiota fuliginosa MF-IS2]|uniref:Uncharacterized protein n=1 Tax=Macrolepiota fuliginosa MF-IS2 TaxID=1400762 RepID=A0A9P5X4F5_9AGAR|nr:hypothetical protein P691DRAFT_712076 [Macrolepiota fuliginosa MF-IS2]
MNFLESPAVTQQAVSVMKKELKKLGRRESKLEAQISAAQAHLNENSDLVQQRPAAANTLVNILTTQAEDASLRVQKLRSEVGSLQEDISRVRQGTEESTSDTEDTVVLRAGLLKYVARGEKYRDRVQSLQLEKTALEKEIQERQNNTNFDRVPLYKRVLAGYPPVSRPYINNLDPVADYWEDLEEILQFNEYTRSCLSNSHYMPYGVVWHDPHAVIFWPSCVFNSRSRKWEPSHFSQGYDGQTYNLFLGRGSYLFYRGTYQFHRTQDHTWNAINDKYSYIFLKQALDLSIPHQPSNVDRQTLRGLILDNVLSLECTLLQCVGFDEELYRSLVRRFYDRGKAGYERTGIYRADNNRRKRDEDWQAVRQSWNAEGEPR